MDDELLSLSADWFSGLWRTFVWGEQLLSRHLYLDIYGCS